MQKQFIGRVRMNANGRNPNEHRRAYRLPVDLPREAVLVCKPNATMYETKPRVQRARSLRLRRKVNALVRQLQNLDIDHLSARARSKYLLVTLVHDTRFLDYGTRFAAIERALTEAFRLEIRDIKHHHRFSWW